MNVTWRAFGEKRRDCEEMHRNAVGDRGGTPASDL